MSLKIDNKIWKNAERLASQPYETSVVEDTLSDGTPFFLVSNPELPGCRAHGATQAEAEASLKDVRKDVIYFLLLDGLTVPRPRTRMIVSSESATTTMRIIIPANRFIIHGKKTDQAHDSTGDYESKPGKFSYFNLTRS